MRGWISFASELISTLTRSSDVFIALMGVTGSGKSSFISLCCGKAVKVGHELNSCKPHVIPGYMIEGNLLKTFVPSPPQAQARLTYTRTKSLPARPYT